MWTTWARGFVVSLAVLFLASAVLAQGPENQTLIPTAPKADCEPNNCVSKVLYVPEFFTAQELQDVANTYRTIVDFRIIYPKQSDQHDRAQPSNSLPLKSY